MNKLQTLFDVIKFWYPTPFHLVTACCLCQFTRTRFSTLIFPLASSESTESAKVLFVSKHRCMNFVYGRLWRQLYVLYKKKSVFFARGKREAVFLQGRKQITLVRGENKTSNDCRKISKPHDEWWKSLVVVVGFLLRLSAIKFGVTAKYPVHMQHNPLHVTRNIIANGEVMVLFFCDSSHGLNVKEATLEQWRNWRVPYVTRFFDCEVI